MTIFRKWTAVLVPTLLCSVSAFAEICTTQSKGIYFMSANLSVSDATSDVLNKCRGVSVTNNTECSQNVACGMNLNHPYRSGNAACYTQSHNVSFQVLGSPENVASMVSTAISQCREVSVTNNTECGQNATCGDYMTGVPYPSGKAVCSTQSHNITFTEMGQSDQVPALAGKALQDCRSNSVTNNQECTDHITCVDGGMGGHRRGGPDRGDGGYVPRRPIGDGMGGAYRRGEPIVGRRQGNVVTCVTASHNINFQKSGPRDQVNQVSTAVLAECRSNSVTNNTECAQNLRCD